MLVGKCHAEWVAVTSHWEERPGSRTMQGRGRGVPIVLISEEVAGCFQLGTPPPTGREEQQHLCSRPPAVTG